MSPLFKETVTYSAFPQACQSRLARLLTLAFGLLATAIAFYISTFDHIIEAYTTIVSLFNGPILALFLLGMLTRRASFWGWLEGAILAVVGLRCVQLFTEVHWVYYFPLSFGITIIVGYISSFLFPGKRPKDSLILWTVIPSLSRDLQRPT